MTDCGFCSYAERRPELVIHTTSRWMLVHVDRFWPEGALYLVSRGHGLFSDLTVEDWREAAPLLSGCSRMLVEVGGAERTYLASFSERSLHFHMLMFPKRSEHSAAHDGKKATALLASLVATDEPLDSTRVAEWVQRYRSAVESYVPG